MPEQAIGIDIGGTKIAIGAVTDDGNVVAQRTIPTDAAEGFENALARLMEALKATLQDAGWEAGSIAGIGMGCPGPIAPETRRIKNWYTLPGWDGCDIVTPLENAFGRPVHMANDADVALLGEARAGAARGARNVVMFTIGTGVGGAALIDGRIHRGASGNHPEIGHVPVLTDGPPCYCGTNGCFEAVAAGPAIERAGAEVGLSSTQAVFEAAAGGNTQAQAIIGRAQAATTTAVWAVLHSFLPEMILFGGGVMDAQFALYERAAQQALDRATLIPPGIRVEKAALGNGAGIVGAAALAA